MVYWILMLIAAEIIPFVLYRIGKRYLSDPPKNREDLFRCRIRGAEKSEETWDFTHRLCGELWFKAGFYLLFLVAIGMILFIRQKRHFISIAALSIIVFELFLFTYSLFVIHKRLKREFDKEGHRITDPDKPIERNKDMYL